MSDLGHRLNAATQKLCRWRGLYAGWWFGTRPLSDPQAQAARDNFDRTIMLRCDVNAITKLLIDKGVFTVEEFSRQLLDEVEHMDREQERIWPGFHTDETGLVFANLLKCAQTMKERGFAA